MAINYREAREADTALVLQFIRDLAEYVGASNLVTAAPDDIKKNLFCDYPKVFCYLAEMDEKPAGFILCYYKFSTFQGKMGIYIEDLFVKPQYRRHGIGSTLLKKIADRALREDCGRIQWLVRDWNKDAFDFYARIGAERIDNLIVMRVEGDDIKKLAA